MKPNRSETPVTLEERTLKWRREHPRVYQGLLKKPEYEKRCDALRKKRRLKKAAKEKAFRDKIMALHALGDTPKEIAQKMNITREWIYQYYKKLGIEKNKKSRSRVLEEFNKN